MLIDIVVNGRKIGLVHGSFGLARSTCCYECFAIAFVLMEFFRVHSPNWMNNYRLCNFLRTALFCLCFFWVTLLPAFVRAVASAFAFCDHQLICGHQTWKKQQPFLRFSENFLTNCFATVADVRLSRLRRLRPFQKSLKSRLQCKNPGREKYRGSWGTHIWKKFFFYFTWHHEKTP